MNDFIYVLTVAERVAGVLSNDNPGACPYFLDTWTEREDDAMISYEFSIPMNHEDARNVNEEGYIIRRSPAGELTLLQIISVEEDHTKDESIKYVYCENSGLELLGNFVEPADYTGQTVGQAIGNVLEGTRWELGQNDFTAQVTTKIDDYQTALAVVHEIAKDIGAKIQFRVEMDGLMVSRRIVDFLVRRGRDTGKRFEYGKNIEGITRKADRSTVATAIIPLGKGGSEGDQLTIKNVVWSKANGDPVDKPAGQNWIGDEDARMKWGNGGFHIYKKFESDLEDPVKLIKAGWDELQIKKEASVTYEMKVVLLQQLTGYEYEMANIGDGISIFDPTFQPQLMLTGRILEIAVSFTEPSKSEITLGNYQLAKSNINQMIRDIQTTLYRNETVWMSGGTKITAFDTPPANPAVDEFWLDTSKSPVEVLKRWNGTTWKSATPEEADQIKESAGRKWAGQSGADITSVNTSRDTTNVGGKPSDQVRDEATAGQDAKDKIDVDVGSGIIETIEGSAEKATEARQGAIQYTNEHSERQAFIGPSAPTGEVLEGDKWIDTALTPVEVWKVYRNGVWKELGRTNLADMGGTIQTGQIGIGAVKEQQLADLAISLAKIQNNSINSDKIISRSILAGDILANSITGYEISAKTITADEIAVGAITAEKIMAGQITSDMISTIGLSAEVIKFGVMSGDRILANTIDANRLKAGSIIADNILFKGTLDGARGTFSGSILVGNLTEYGEISLSNGILKSDVEQLLSSTEELRISTEMSSGGLEFEYSVYDMWTGNTTARTTTMKQTENYLEIDGDMFITGDFIVNQVQFRSDGANITPYGTLYIGEDPSGGGGTFTVERYAELLADVRFGSGSNVGFYGTADFWGTVNMLSAFNVSGTADFNGTAYFDGANTYLRSTRTYFSGTYNYLGATYNYIQGQTTSFESTNLRYLTQPVSAVVETGYCGLQSESGSSAYTTGIGYGVNFKMSKDYVPSNVAITRDSGNLANSGVFVGYVTAHGFWFQITRANLVGTNTAWRGTYRA